MRGRALVFTGVAVLATRLSIAGCDDATSHIYPGEPYDPTLGCLAPLTGVDVVDGPEPTNACAPLCILSPPQDGGIIAYVSTMCPPYPNYPNVIDAGASPLCVAALDAFKRDALCEDGGVVLPSVEDAGGDAEAGADASDATSPDASDATPPDATADATSTGDATADATAD